MYRTTKPICLFVLALFCLVLLAGVPAGAQGLAKITNVKLTDEGTPGYIETDIDGITPKDPYYSVSGDGGDELPMNRASEVQVCIKDPTVFGFGPDNCRTVLSSTFGAAWNTWVCWGGLWFWFAP